jgi:AraC-like DNA-binding protein
VPVSNRVEWYEPVDPPTELARVLACAWTAEPTGEHRLTPDACCDLLRIEGGRFVLCGPERTSWTFELPPGSTAVGVRFRPGLVRTVFGLDVATIRDRRVPLEDVVGDELAARADAAVAAARSADARRDALVAVVRELATRDGRIVEPEPEAELILRAIAAAPSANQAELSATLGVSVRTLHRVSCRHFGYGTATLARILRFQRFCSVVSTATAPQSLAAFAASAGYADQAHLSRDCRAITSLTTQAFLAEYFPTFPDMADPFKTDDRRHATLGP